MQRHIILIITLTLTGFVGWGQDKSDSEWVKNPATNMYSLEHDRKEVEDMDKEAQMEYSNIDIEKIKKDLQDNNENVRLNAVYILGRIPGNNQISKIENLLINDPSKTVQIECAKSLKYLKSTNSIPVLLKALKTDDEELKLEVAMSLALLGEKKECFKTLNDLEKTGNRNNIPIIHLGYLDLATYDAIEQLKTDLSDTNSDNSLGAAIILAELGYFKDAFPTLKSKLADPDKYVRGGAIRGLEYIGNDKSINLIRSMINDKDKLIREEIERFLKSCHLN